MEVGELESVDAETGQKAPKRVGRKRKRSEVDGERPERGEERMNVEEKDPKRKVSHKYRVNNQVSDTRLNRTPAQPIRKT